MIRTVQRRPQRIGFLCPILNPWNPFCAFGEDNPSVSSDPNNPSQCYGGGPNADVAACAAAGNRAAAQYAAAHPAEAQDYQDVQSGDLISLANPFTGTGPLSPSSTSVPTWAWLLGAGVGGLLLLRR